MSSPHRADTPFEAGDKRLVLCYDLNGLATVMEVLGVKRPEELTAERTSLLGIQEVRKMLWAGLQRHYPEMTEQEVGALDYELEYAVEQMTQALMKGISRRTPPKASRSNRGPKA